MKQRYRQAHHEARLNRRLGHWLRNPVRLLNGWPGVFVGADGRPRYFAGFNQEKMFPVYHG